MTPSALNADRGRKPTWTRDNLIEKIQRWVALYGEPPRAADLNPSAARWGNQEWRIDRYQAGDPETGERWPSLNALKGEFGGSLNAAIRAAGFEPNKSGPPARKALGDHKAVDRLLMSPEARVALDAARAEVRVLAERVAVRDRQLATAKVANDRLREERVVVRRPVPVTKVKTKVVRERVEDTRAVARLQAKLDKAVAARESAEAVARAERDRTRATARELSRARARVEALELAVTQADAEAKGAQALVVSLEDRLTVAEARRERVVIKERVVRSATDEEVDEARRAASAAEQAADEAELRAAKAEREYRELVSVVRGEPRKLTQGELDELRAAGPSGPAVLAAAIKELAVARKRRPAAVAAALSKVASAAVGWRDAIR